MPYSSFLLLNYEKNFLPSNVKYLHKGMSCPNNSKDISLAFPPPISWYRLHLKAFADYLLQKDGDVNSQLGYILLLCDTFKSHIIQYISKKSKIIVRSVLSREAYAFANAFDCNFSIEHDVDHMTSRIISLQIFTDSKPLFDVITKCSNTEWKRLMIDTQNLRKGYDLG